MKFALLMPFFVNFVTLPLGMVEPIERTLRALSKVKNNRKENYSSIFSRYLETELSNLGLVGYHHDLILLAEPKILPI